MDFIEIWLSSIVAFAMMEGIGRIRKPVSNKRRWVRRLENSWLRWPFKGLMASIAGPLTLWWMRNRLEPSLGDNPLSMLIFTIAAFVSMGIGWTIGQWCVTNNTVVVGGSE